MDGYFTIKEVIDNYIDVCRGKIESSSKNIMGKAILAGMMIAMGAGISSVAAHTISDIGLPIYYLHSDK